MLFSVPFPSIRGWIIATLCGLLLTLVSGCSALRIGYSTAPDLAYWWFDRYADFSGEQTQRVREALAQWFNWHRRTQLPDYAALLARMRAEAPVDTTAERVCEWQADLLRRADTAYDRAGPAIAELVLSLTPEQIAHIQKRQSKVNEDFREDYLQPDRAKRAAATLKRTVERAEMIYGKLDAGQRERMAAALTRSPFDPELWDAERRARQQDVVQLIGKLVKEKTPPAQAQAELRGYVDRIERSPHEAYRRYYERLTEFNCGFVANLHNSTTAEQRRHAVQTLSGWEGDLRALAASTPPAVAESSN